MMKAIFLVCLVVAASALPKHFNHLGKGKKSKLPPTPPVDKCLGITCSVGPANTVPTCVDGFCFYSCAANFADCDGTLVNGCEIDTSTDINNCGSCGNVCFTDALTTPTCAAGVCGLTCNSCGAPSDLAAPAAVDCGGFCTCVDTDSYNCGTCGNVCSLAGSNAIDVCAAGACPALTCLTNFGDCDLVYSSGCEVDFGAVGTCGTTCADIVNCNTDPNAEFLCVPSNPLGSRCAFQRCRKGFELGPLGNCVAKAPKAKGKGKAL